MAAALRITKWGDNWSDWHDQSFAPATADRPAAARGERVGHGYGKKTPLRSLPISANELDDVASGSDS